MWKKKELAFVEIGSLRFLDDYVQFLIDLLYTKKLFVFCSVQKSFFFLKQVYFRQKNSRILS